MRVWLHDTISAALTVQAIFGNPARVWPGGSLEKPPTNDECPFLVYRIGIESPALTGGGTPGEHELPKRQYGQVWAHHRGGDYDVVDAGLAAVRSVLQDAPHQGTFLEARWIETSRDLTDPDLATICRYHRYLFTFSR